MHKVSSIDSRNSMKEKLAKFFKKEVPYSSGVGNGGQPQVITMSKTKIFPEVILDHLTSDERTHMSVTHDNGKLVFEFMWLPESTYEPFYHEFGGKPSIVVQIVATASTEAFWEMLREIAPAGRLTWGEEVKKWVNNIH